MPKICILHFSTQSNWNEEITCFAKYLQLWNNKLCVVVVGKYLLCSTGTKNIQNCPFCQNGFLRHIFICSEIIMLLFFSRRMVDEPFHEIGHTRHTVAVGLFRSNSNISTHSSRKGEPQSDINTNQRGQPTIKV